jgi:hypothetical protein
MASARNIRAGAAYIELFINDSKLVRGLQRASQKLKAFGEAIAGWGKKLMALGGMITAPLVGFAKMFAAGSKELQTMSQRTGISVEALSELSYATQLCGVTLDDFEVAIKRMQKTIVGAAEGSDTATEALGQLGLTVEDLRGLSPDQQFKLIADRLSGIQSPALRAALAMQIFGRQGTALLPMLLQGAAGIEAMQEEARKLGLTASRDGVAAGVALEESLTTLWKVLKKLGTTLGSAIAPLLTRWINSTIDIVVKGMAWIKQNKDLVLSVFKIALAITAGGFALLLLGKAIIAVGAIMGTLAAILAWLVTPIGLVTVAIAALGAYLIYASGAGGQALAWLGDRFKDLSDFASASFQGISDALMAGDIALAAKILWLSLKIAWQTGVLQLTKLWEWLKTGSLKIVYDLWYGAQAAWEIGVDSVSKVMLQLYYFMQSTWESMATGVMDVWDTTVNWVAKRLIDLQGLVDDSIDTEAVKKGLDEDLQATITTRNQEKDANLQALDAQRDAALKMAEEEHDAKMAEIGQASFEKENQLDSDAQQKIAQSQKELDQAKAEWQQAIAEAKKKRELHDSQGLDRLQPPPSLPDMLEGLGPTIQETKKTIGVAGTFNAMEAKGLGGGGVTDRIAKASEDTARNTKQMLQEIQLGGGEFE